LAACNGKRWSGTPDAAFTGRLSDMGEKMLETILIFLVGWLALSFLVACAVGKFIRAGAVDQVGRDEREFPHRTPSRVIPHRA